MIEGELIDFICTEIAYDRLTTLAADAPLLNGALDSIDVLRLVVFVEERYDTKIEDDELIPENFETVQSLAALLESKRAG